MMTTDDITVLIIKVHGDDISQNYFSGFNVNNALVMHF